MGFLGHLEELRKRIIWSIVSVAAGFSICYCWHEDIFGLRQRPIQFALERHHLPVNLVYTNPTDPFNMYLEISLIVGIFGASPFVLYQVWAFIAPGLCKSERRYVAPFMCSTVGLFVSGGYFAYKMVYPAALDFLINYSKQFTPMITIDEYTALFMTIVLGLGAVFEMLIHREFPRLCRGGIRSLTNTGVHPRNSIREPPSTRKGEPGWTSMRA